MDFLAKLYEETSESEHIPPTYDETIMGYYMPITEIKESGKPFDVYRCLSAISWLKHQERMGCEYGILSFLEESIVRQYGASDSVVCKELLEKFYCTSRRRSACPQNSHSLRLIVIAVAKCQKVRVYFGKGLEDSTVLLPYALADAGKGVVVYGRSTFHRRNVGLALNSRYEAELVCDFFPPPRVHLKRVEKLIEGSPFLV
ncbi:MAG: hypothetical protein KDA66_16725 [Planctomycetaceae bacterium]|nr:hypothetical protein [Planctomycetaceae bacterium]